MAAPIYFPWPAVALFLGTLLGAAGLAAPVDPAGALPALFGALTGLVGAFLSPKSRAWPGMLAGLAGFALLALGPGPLVLWLACLAFSAGAGLESLRTGGRATVMTLHGVQGRCLTPWVIMCSVPVITVLVQWPKSVTICCWLFIWRALQKRCSLVLIMVWILKRLAKSC